AAGHGGAVPTAPDRSGQPFIAHQPVDGACRDVVAVSAQVHGHLPATVETFGGADGLTQSVRQMCIGDGPAGWRSSFPVPIRAWGDLDATLGEHGADRLGPRVLVHASGR